MKAWIVDDKDYYNGSVILFAETRGKALAYAVNMDEFDGAEWIDLRARRFKGFDKYYKGYTELDWYDDEIRLTLVKDFGWACEEADSIWCEECVAKQYCGEWQRCCEYLEDEDDN